MRDHTVVRVLIVEDERQLADSIAEGLRLHSMAAPDRVEADACSISDYSEGHNRPLTVKSNRGYGQRYIVPGLGR